MRILMVSPYAPMRDGIAAYAVQAVRRLRREGNDVEVLSPGPSAAHHHLDLVGPRGALALARRVRDYDKIIVQFHPDFFYPHPATWRERAAVSAALTTAWRAAHEVEIRVHEVDYRWGEQGPDRFANRQMFRAADRIVVHTDAEADAFHRAFGVPEKKIEVTAHGADFVKRVELDQAGARRQLGIPADEFMFLAIGFIQPHKGFDRAITAFTGLQGCRLDIVGSLRVEEPDYVRHLEVLEKMAGGTPGVHLHIDYVNDDAFDTWLAASDVVVLPYRSIWSSGVLERALLYERQVIVTRVGGLAWQVGDRDGVTVVDDDAGLATAMHKAAGLVVDGGPSPSWPYTVRGHDAVMAEIRARAATARGGRPYDREQAPASDDVLEASAPLRRTTGLGRPEPTSRRPGVSIVKRLFRRASDWEIHPIVHQLNVLREATIDALENTAAASQDDDVRAAIVELRAEVEAIARRTAGPDGGAVVSHWRPRFGDLAGTRSVATDVGELLFPEWDTVILPALEQDGKWEPDEGAWLRARIKPGMTVLDVGANVGYHALLAAGAVGDSGRVIALEPDPLNYSLLLANCRRNGVTNVDAVPAAAGATTGSIELVRSRDNVGDHRCYPRPDAGESVQVAMVAIDDLLGPDTRVDVAVIDTQGFDHHVIEGMATVIERWRPLMLVEFWLEGIAGVGEDPVAIIDDYRRRGYDVTSLECPSFDRDTPAQAFVDAAAANRGGYITLVLTPTRR